MKKWLQGKNLFRKFALVLVLLVTCFTFSACSWWGGNNNGGNNNGNNQGTNTPGGSTGSETGGGYNPDDMLAQMPTVKAIAGVYMPEADEISDDSLKTRNAIYAGVKNAAINAVSLPTEPQMPTKSEGEDDATFNARVEAYVQQKANIAALQNKRNKIGAAVDMFFDDKYVNFTNLNKLKYGLFADEVNALLNTEGIILPGDIAAGQVESSFVTYVGITKISGSGSFTANGITKTATAEAATHAEAIKNAVKSYLTNSNNVPGTAVEGETGEYAGVLVSPIVEIQIFYVKSFKVKIEPGSSYLPDIPTGTPTMEQFRDVYYYDDENGYSTRFAEVDGDNKLISYDAGKDDTSERYILPQRKWLTFYFEVAPSKEGGEFFFRSVEAVITFDKSADNAEDVRSALLNYSGVVTAKSSQTNVDYSAGLQKYKFDFKEYHAKTIEEIEQEGKEQGLGDNYKIDDDTRKLIEKENERLEELYSGYCLVNCNLFKASEPLGSRAPKLEKTLIENVKLNKNYSTAIVFSKQQVGDISFYAINSKAENINSSVAINVATGGEVVSFGVENLKIGVSEDDKISSELMPNFPSSN